jgi:hypothetical protein
MQLTSIGSWELCLLILLAINKDLESRAHRHYPMRRPIHNQDRNLFNSHCSLMRAQDVDHYNHGAIIM